MTDEVSVYARYQPGLKGLPDRERMRPSRDPKDGRSPPSAVSNMNGSEWRRSRLLHAHDARVGTGRPRASTRSSASGIAGYWSRVVPWPIDSSYHERLLYERFWHFRSMAVQPCHGRRLDFLLNNRRWTFDMDPEYTVHRRLMARRLHLLRVFRFGWWASRLSGRCFFMRNPIRRTEFTRSDRPGPELEVPLLPSQAAADLLAAMLRRAALSPRCWTMESASQLGSCTRHTTGPWERRNKAGALERGELRPIRPAWAGERGVPRDERCWGGCRAKPVIGSAPSRRRCRLADRVDSRFAGGFSCGSRFETSRIGRTLAPCLRALSHRDRPSSPIRLRISRSPKVMISTALSRWAPELPSIRLAGATVRRDEPELLHPGRSARPTLDNSPTTTIGGAAARLSCPDDRFV